MPITIKNALNGSFYGTLFITIIENNFTREDSNKLASLQKIDKTKISSKQQKELNRLLNKQKSNLTDQDLYTNFVTSSKSLLGALIPRFSRKGNKVTVLPFFLDEKILNTIPFVASARNSKQYEVFDNGVFQRRGENTVELTFVTPKGAGINPFLSTLSTIVDRAFNNNGVTIKASYFGVDGYIVTDSLVQDYDFAPVGLDNETLNFTLLLQKVPNTKVSTVNSSADSINF